jgi:hypothetical protein
MADKDSRPNDTPDLEDAIRSIEAIGEGNENGGAAR